jgi:hypothetical protein
MEAIEKYLPLALAILLTVGGYVVERSIFSSGLPTMNDYRWISYGLGGFVFLLWAVAMLVIGVTYKDLAEQRLILTSWQVVKLSK